MSVGIPMNNAIKGTVDITDLEDWGPKPNAIGPAPLQRGRSLLGGGDDRLEVGIWQCSPGTYILEAKSDEFCHILTGRWRLTHEGGEVMELEAGDSLLIPSGWKGKSEVLETVRKIH